MNAESHPVEVGVSEVAFEERAGRLGGQTILAKTQRRQERQNASDSDENGLQLIGHAVLLLRA